MKRGARLLAWGILALALASSTSCLGGKDYIEVDAIFDDVGDLARLANVQSADVSIGSVQKIMLEGYNARVTVRIDSRSRLPRNSIALVRSTSLLGEKFVDLRPPEDPPPSAERLRDGDLIPLERTAKVPALDDALIKLGKILEGGSAADLAVFINSAADIVRDKQAALGEVFGELRKLTDTLAANGPEIVSAIDGLDRAFATLAGDAGTLRSAVKSSADAAEVLARQEMDLDKLIGSLDRFAEVAARYASATRADSDQALKDLRLILDKVMTTTGDLDKSLTALAQFSNLWPRAMPGDYVQLDVVLHSANAGPSSVSGPAQVQDTTAVSRAPGSLRDLLFRAVR